jgi:hypothetical protein
LCTKTLLARTSKKKKTSRIGSHVQANMENKKKPAKIGLHVQANMKSKKSQQK